jgi:hypothetical protein
MTYGFRPENWWIFERELRTRGIAVSEIEKLEMRSLATDDSIGTACGALVTVTLRSGRVDTWVHEQAAISR